MDLFSEHATLLMERFPRLGLLSATWEPLEAFSETPQEEISNDVQLLYIYGIGEGSSYEKYKNWLHGDKERLLIFLEDEPGYIASFLEKPQAKELLLDEQVNIEIISQKKGRAQELERISEKYPVRRLEVISLPSKKGSRFRAIRLTLFRKTTLAHGLHFDRIQGFQPFSNFVQNLKILPRSFYANTMKGAFEGVPAIVCGAGPSLQTAIPFLKEHQDKVLIIAGGSTLAALSSEGIRPHFGMAIDPNLEEYLRFKNTFTFEVPLLYCTRVFPWIFRTCNGPFGYMRTGIGGMSELWLEEQLGLKEPLLGDHLNAETMSVTAICLAWAQFLGCNPIFLSGVDLAYTGKKRYATGVAEEVPFHQVQREKGASDHIYKRKDRLGNTVYTAVRWVMESSCISFFAKKHPETTFINTTEGGIGFKAIPYQPLSEVLEQHCKKNLHLEERVHQAISSSPMPIQTEEIIQVKMKELQLSLDRVMECFHVLWKEKSIGKRALAEVDLSEEMAYACLFYDAEKLYGEKEDKWELLYKQASRYKENLRDFI